MTLPGTVADKLGSVASSEARVHLRVTPGARRAAIVGRHGRAWKVKVQAAPERGKANEAVVTLIAGTLGIAPSDVRVISGHGARDKIVELAGLDSAEVERRLISATGHHDQ